MNKDIEYADLLCENVVLGLDQFQTTLIEAMRLIRLLYTSCDTNESSKRDIINEHEFAVLKIAFHVSLGRFGETIPDNNNVFKEKGWAEKYTLLMSLLTELFLIVLKKTEQSSIISRLYDQARLLIDLERFFEYGQFRPEYQDTILPFIIGIEEISFEEIHDIWTEMS